MTGSPRRRAGFPTALATLVLAAWIAGCAPAPAPSGDAGTGAPARRIVTLAPHLAELVYAAGAGHRLVAVVEYSSQPPPVARLPRVGDAFRVDLESVAAARPDLILAWPSGNSPATVQQLQRLGYRVVGLEPASLEDIGRQMAIIGRLAGTSATADRAAAQWAQALRALRERHRGLAPVRTFYQVAPRPLVTVSDRHFIGQAITLCGGANVFARVPGLAPVIGAEAVVAARPEAIVANALEPGPGGAPAASPLAAWRQWPQLPAVARGNLFQLDPNLMSVPGPRLLAGIEALCADLSVARRNAGAVSPLAGPST